MTVWVVIWVVLMMFWLFGGVWVHYTPGQPNAIAVGPVFMGTLIPWACVLILGLITFGAITPGAGLR